MTSGDRPRWHVPRRVGGVRRGRRLPNWPRRSPVPFEGDAREFPDHPRVERVMHEQVRQQR